MQPQEDNERRSADNSGEKPKKGFISELVKLALITLLVVVPFRIYIAQPFVVNGASMEPTFTDGDYLIVDQITYRFDKPKRGDVLIFRFPQNPRKFFIKRLIGLPGETVKINAGIVTILNEDYPEGLVLNEPYIKFQKFDDFSVSLKSEEYFVLGDNRMWSADSRSWGPLPEELIVGRPIVRLFPIDEIDLNPGESDPELYEEN